MISVSFVCVCVLAFELEIAFLTILVCFRMQRILLSVKIALFFGFAGAVLVAIGQKVGKYNKIFCNRITLKTN